VKLRGTTILTRKTVVTRRFGSDAWRQFFSDMALAHPFFRAPLQSSSLVPLPEFLSLHDELVRRFYGGDDQGHRTLGEESAQWALTQGPLEDFIAKRDLDQVVSSLPELWTMYFAETASFCRTAMNGGVVEFKVFDLPMWHPYLEHFIVGYQKGTLDLLCANPIEITQMRGGCGREYSYLMLDRLGHGGGGAP
jgi:hypothetical protein